MPGTDNRGSELNPREAILQKIMTEPREGGGVFFLKHTSHHNELILLWKTSAAPPCLENNRFTS